MGTTGLDLGRMVSLCYGTQQDSKISFCTVGNVGILWEKRIRESRAHGGAVVL